VWEGTHVERLAVTDALDGHIFKELDTGESYIHRSGQWEFINLGLAFIKATKSGRAVTDSQGNWDIVFETPFIDDQYSIALSCEDPGGPPGVIVYFYSRLPSGFSVKSRNFAGAVKGGVEFSWLATRDYNP